MPVVPAHLSRPWPGFRRLPLVSAIAALLATPVTSADWGPNLEVLLHVDDDRVLGGFEFLAPLWQDASRLGFAEVKAHVSDQGGQEFNVGLGQRWLDDQRGRLYGLFAQYDRRITGWSHSFDQITAGLEVLGNVDLRINYSHALSDAERVHGWVNGIGFRGFETFTQESFEEPLSGWDGEIGVLLPIRQLETRLYAGGYTLSGDLNGDTAGWKARLESHPSKRLSLEVSYRDDPWFGGQAGVTLRYAFGQPAGRGPRTASERMTQPTRRDLDVLVTPPSVTPLQRRVLHAQTIHINSARGLADGDGSFERPYRDPQQCQAAGCNEPGALVRLWQGAPYTLMRPWRLADGQTLWGEGWRIDTAPSRHPDYRNWFDRGRFAPEQAPRLMADLPVGAEAALLVGNAGRISGIIVDARGSSVDADGNGPPVLLADGTAGFVVQGNLLLTDSVGLEVRGAAGAINLGSGSGAPPAPTALWTPDWTLPDGTPIQGRLLDTLVLTGVPADAAPVPALALVNRAGAGTEQTQVVVYRPAATVGASAGNSALSVTDGIRAENQADGPGARAVQQVWLMDAPFAINAGIKLDNRASDGAGAFQDLRILGGTASGSGPLLVRNTATGGAQAVQTVAITTPLELTGLRLANQATDGATATQLVTISGARIIALPGADAVIAIDNRAEGGGQAVQGVALADLRLDSTDHDLVITNRALTTGAAHQQVEVDGTGALAGLDLLNQAEGAARALQQVAIGGLALGTTTGAAWAGIVNGALTDGLAQQAVRLHEMAMSLAAPGGLAVGNGAWLGGQASQAVTLGATGTVGWLSVVNQAAHQGSATQSVAATGLQVYDDRPPDAASPTRAGLEVVNGAFVDASASQTLALDLAGIAVAHGGLQQRNDADTRATATQALRLTAPLAFGTLDIANAATGDALAAQGSVLDAGAGLWIDDARLRNASDLLGRAEQTLDLLGSAGGGLGGLHFENTATGQGDSRQWVTAHQLPLLAADPSGTPRLLAANNRVSGAASGYQSLALDTAAAASGGSRAIVLQNAVQGATGTQLFALTGAPGDQGEIGPLLVNNSADGGPARQAVGITGLDVRAGTGTVPGGSIGQLLRGIELSNQGYNGGEAAQTVALDSGPAGLTAEALNIFNLGSGSETRATQQVTLNGNGETSWLAASNQAQLGAQAGQTLSLTGIALTGMGGTIANAATDAGIGAQQLALDAPRIAPDPAMTLRIANEVNGGSGRQQVDLRTETLSTTALLGGDTVLHWLNSATAGSAAQIGTLAASNLAIGTGTLGIDNDANANADAGQLIGITGQAGAAAVDRVRIANRAQQGARAHQAATLTGLAIRGQLAVDDQAVLGGTSAQAATLAVSLPGAALSAFTSAAAASASQTIALTSDPNQTLTGLAISAAAGGDGTAAQWFQGQGLGRVSGPGDSPARLETLADGATVGQVVDLSAVTFSGARQGLLIAGGADHGGASTQQVTLREAAATGADVGILTTPTTPRNGQVSQHLLLWSTDATSRFEPAVIHSLDELRGLTQTLTVDGVRRTIWRTLILPDGSGVLIPDDGHGAGVIDIGGGGFIGGAVTINNGGSGLTIRPWRPTNLGDLFGRATGDLVHGLQLPPAADLPPGFSSYVEDLLRRRGEPLPSDVGLGVGSTVQFVP